MDIHFSQPLDSLILFHLPAGFLQHGYHRHNDDSRNDGFRYTIHADNAKNRSPYSFYGNSFSRRIGSTYEDEEGTQEEHRVAERTADGCYRRADTFPTGHMFIQEPGKESDADSRNDADKGIVERIILQGKLQQQAWRPKTLDKREQSEKETYKGPYLRTSCNGTDNGGDVQDGCIHNYKGNETIPREPQKNSYSRQKAGNGELADTQKCMTSLGCLIDFSMLKTSVLTLHEI